MQLSLFGRTTSFKIDKPIRLMGIRDEYSKRITCSNAQKYKQAGNGIVVDVLMAIFKQML